MNCIEPKIVTIIQTRQCTATCPNCSFRCSPTNHVWIDLSDAEAFVRSCLLLYPSIEVLVITGGECTLKWDDLIALIKLGKSLGLVTRIVTNGHWAVNREKAYSKAKLLREAGLEELNVSTGDEHLGFVPLERVVNTIEASVELGMTCVVNIESHKNSQFKVNDLLKIPSIAELVLKSPSQKLIFSNSLWVELRTKKGLSYDGLALKEARKGCDSILTTLAMNPYGYQLACCGITVEYIEALILGEAKTSEEVRRNMKNQYQDLMKLWIFSQGATHVLDRLNESMGNPKQEGCRHPCVDCILLFENPQYADYLSCHKSDFIGEIMLHYEYKRRLLRSSKFSHEKRRIIN